MKIPYLLLIVLLLTQVSTKDTLCNRSGKVWNSLVLNKGDSYSFSTEGSTYKNWMKCHTLYKMGTCDVAVINCDVFNTIASKEKCFWGDYLAIADSQGFQRFCRNNGPKNLKRTKDFKLRFISNGKKAGRGVSCTVECPPLTGELVDAAADGNVELVRSLLDRGADIDSRHPESNVTALMRAAEKNYSEILKILLDRGANLDLQDSKGRTALFLATPEDYKEIVALLLEKGADHSTRDGTYGGTALMMAAANGYEEIVKLLLKKGADLNIRDNDGVTALILAAVNRFEEIVKLLLKKGADPNIRDNDGVTALMMAAANGYEEIVKLLLKKGADPNIRDNDGVTALDWATNTEVANIIKEYGGKTGAELYGSG